MLTDTLWSALPGFLSGAAGATVVLLLERRFGGAGRPNNKKKKKQAVPITAEDRKAPPRPELEPLRPVDSSRVDQSVLLRLAPVHPAGAAGSAVLVLPGGNYDNCNLFMPLQVAAWLTELGITAYVLRYRLRTEGHYWPAQLEDYECAIRRIRARALAEPERGVRPDRVGVIGFSAGGHLASVAATMVAKEDRPNFHMLVYASTNVETPVWDPWKARLGYPGPELSTIDKVTKDTPPLFAAVSTEDDVTSYAENTLPYVQACRREGVEAEVVLAKMGPHGHGLLDAWTKPCEAWLRKHGWAQPPASTGKSSGVAKTAAGLV